MRCSLVVVFVIAAVLPLHAQVRSTATAPYVNFESGPVRPLLLSPDATRLYVLNSPDHRLEVYATSVGNRPGPHRGNSAGLRLLGSVFTGLEPSSMALDPTDPSTLFVANLISDSIAVVDLPSLTVRNSFYIGDEPRDIEIVAGKLYVPCARSARLSNPSSFVRHVVVVADASAPHDRLALLKVRGHKPRSVTSDGSHVYVVPQNSGNHTTTLSEDDALSLGITPLTEDAFDTNFILNETLASSTLDAFQFGWSIPQTGRVVFDWEFPSHVPQLVDRDVSAIDVSTDTVDAAFTTAVATTLFAIERNPTTGDLWVLGTDAGNRTRMEYNLTGAIVENRIVVVEPTPGGSVKNTLLLAPPLTASTHAQPVALSFYSGSAGELAYVAALGTASILVFDSATLALVDEFEVTAMPSGLAVDSVNDLLYVYSKGDFSVQVLDIRAGHLPVDGPTHLAYNPEPPEVTEGRLQLYDARVDSGAGTGNSSCATCHLFGDTDGVAWDLGNSQGGVGYYFPDVMNGFLGFPGFVVADSNTPVINPMKGPMVTQTLRGAVADLPLHWRGDRRHLHNFRVAFPGLLGGTGISDRAVQTYVAFLRTLAHPPNPFQPKDRVYDGPADQGLQKFGLPPHAGKDYSGLFPGLTCVACHEADFGNGDFSGTQPFVGFDAEFQLMNPTQLRGTYEKEFRSLTGFGTRHDGTREDIRDFLDLQFLGLDVFDQFTSLDRDQTAAFVEAWDTGLAPLVGDQATLNAVTEATKFLDLAEAQAQPPSSNIDLIVKGWRGRISGKLVKFGGTFAFNPGTGDWRYLRDNGKSLTRATLVAWASAGSAEMVFTAVPPGLGVRLGIDQDEDGLLDREEIDLGTRPDHPDSDGDGYSDAAELVLGGDPTIHDDFLPDSTAPQFIAHGAEDLFTRSATLRVVTDEPTTLDVELGLGGRSQTKAGNSDELRQVHQVVLLDLMPGVLYQYTVRARDRNGNRTVATGNLRTQVPHLHVSSVQLAQLQDDPVILEARIQVVDQLGNPIPGIPVHGILAGDIGANLDTFEAVTDATGTAIHTLDAYQPGAPDTVTVSPLFVGSLDRLHPYFVGVGGGMASFFYEQAANTVNFATRDVD